jgi:hypothetical protein
LASDFAGFERNLMLSVLECFGDFVKHGVSFLFLPADFQALSSTSPQMTNCHLLPQLQTAKKQNARISELTRAFQGISKIVASNSMSGREAQSYDLYDEHRRPEIGLRSRFIEVPSCD